jgi:carboxypeptidase Taq
VDAYRELEATFRRLSNVEAAAGVLRWDWATMMPSGGAEARTEQLATLDGIAHELVTAPKLAERLDAAEAEAEGAALEEWQAVNLALMRRRWRRAAALSPALVDAFARATAACEMCWREARANDDFAAVAPSLETVVGLVREIAGAHGEAFGLAPYDALVDAHDPGATAAAIDPIFADLQAFLPGFTEQVLERQARQPELVRPDGPFAVAAQQRLAERLMAVAGFDTDHGRLDVSHHPFTGGVPDDIRITTRYREDDFTESVMAVMHETGHALYERGLPAVWRHQPVGESAGMSVHESQSLLIEMQVCRGHEFLSFAAPLIRETLDGAGPGWEIGHIHRLYNRVERAFIRVEADEVTYPAHVLVRYRLERALIDGALEVAELPAAWARAMEELLGLTPATDRDGCLQDIHWFAGEFGYFPTYTLGALAAAQLFDAATRTDAEIVPGISSGSFVPLLRWLGDNVHGLGARYSRDELLIRATGRPLGTAAFKAHLKTRYLG